MTWKAQWIWDSDRFGPANHYVYFRKLVRLTKSKSYHSPARVCAWTGYKLFVNGDFICHGPARSDLKHVAFDQYDIGSKLRPGENVIAALVHFEGIGTAYSLVGQAGFLFEAEIEGEDHKQLITSDATWRAKAAPYQSGYDRISIQLAYPEDFDAHQEPIGWNRPGYKDDWWSHATVLGPIGMEPWGELVPRDIPMQRYRTVAPVKMHQVNLCDRTPPPPPRESGPVDLVKHPEKIADQILEAQKPPPKPPSPAEIMERATRLIPSDPSAVSYRHPAHFTVQSVSGMVGTSVVLDYGREVSGFPWLQIRKGGGGRVDIGYSERLEDDGSMNPNRWGGCDVHYADRLRMRPGPQKWTSFHPRAFRYLRLDFYDCPEPVEILTELDTCGYPVEQRGEFQCSDPLLNRIWETGRYTAELCMDDAFMDCPWRERGQWLADARVEALVAHYAFGDFKLARRALRQYAQSQGTTFPRGEDLPPLEHHQEAWVKCLYPASPPFDTVLPTFNLIWISALWEHFLHTGDRSLLVEVWPNVEKLLALLKRHESDDHLLTNLPGWVFVDWAPLDVSGEGSHVNAFYVAALLAAAKIARAVGRPDRGGELEMHASDVKESINEALWDPSLGMYRDARIGDQTSNVVSEQANILCILYGISDRAQTEQIFDRLRASTALPPAQNPQISDPRRPVRITTPYFAFYLLRALFDLGRHDQALDYIREHWGRMLSRGATTFWEQYEPQWSLCHAWSAAPTYDLPAHIAGVRPLQPGFEEFAVDLRPAGLTWLRATVPTIRGDIRMSYHCRTDQPFRDPMGGVAPLAHTSPAITLNLSIPKGTTARLSLPLENIERPSVRINDAELATDGQIRREAKDRLSIESGRLSMRLGGGEYHLTVDRPPVDSGRSGTVQP